MTVGFKNFHCIQHSYRNDIYATSEFMHVIAFIIAGFGEVHR